MPAQADLNPVMTLDEVNALMAEAFPQLYEYQGNYRAVDVFPGGCTVRLDT